MDSRFTSTVDLATTEDWTALPPAIPYHSHDVFMSELEAYWNTPQFKAYLAGYYRAEVLDTLRFKEGHRWDRVEDPNKGIQAMYHTQCSENARLLAICRSTPEHKLAFGW